MVKKYLMFDIEDDNVKSLSEVLGSKSCKKILDFLADQDASETDIAKELDMPVNTVEYNLKKLVRVGLVEKAKEFFWSVKGKKIPMYRLSNKHILISPKTKNLKKILALIPSLLISGIAAVLIRQSFLGQTARKTTAPLVEDFIAPAAEAGEAIVETVPMAAPNLWLWFLGGALFALFVFLILNWKRLR